MFLDAQRPEYRQGRGAGEIIRQQHFVVLQKREREAPVGHVAAAHRVKSPAVGEDVGQQEGQQHPGVEQRPDAQAAPDEKAAHVDLAPRLLIGHQQVGDEKTAQHEEKIDANAAAPLQIEEHRPIELNRNVKEKDFEKGKKAQGFEGSEM